MRRLADAARSRSEADWLVGINGTRAMTAFNSRDGGFFLTTVGRVQTPTLSVVVEREEKIRKHVARDYWEVRAELRRPGRHTTRASGSTRSSRRTTIAERRPTGCGRWPRREAIAGGGARPAGQRDARRPSPAPRPAALLYDLTTLQREANSRFGFSAKTTLSLAQSAVREAQGADLPAYRRARAARGLPGRGRGRRFEMIADEALPGPLQRWRRTRGKALQRRLHQAEQARLRQQQGLGPLRHHPDAAGAQAA